MNSARLFISMALFVMTTQYGAVLSAATAQPCDRECLKGFITTYLDALTGKKPDALPLAPDVKFTENCKELKVGEGYWKDVSGTVRYRLDIIDMAQSGAGALVVIKGSASVLFALRLKIANQKISEIETIVTKNSSEGMLFTPDGFKVPPADSAMTIIPKPELLNTRAKMIEIASRYPEAMKKGSASFNANGLYFSKGAYRLENGQLMAGPGCTFLSGCDNIGTQSLPKLSGMVYKPALVDEPAGIVMLRMNFGKGSVMSGSGTLDVMEAFKIYNDSMHCVYAVMRNVPEGTGFGWDYTAICAPKHALRAAALRGTIPVAGGVLITSDLPCDNIFLDLYTLGGRFVASNGAGPVQPNRAMLLPVDMHAQGAGHFIGKIRAISGEKTIDSRVVNLYRMK